jgi:hypothetical protein
MRSKIFPNAGQRSIFVDAYILIKHNRQEWIDARAASNTVFTSVASGPIHVAITQARRRVDTAYSKLQNAESYVENLENNLGVEERWSNISPEYQEFYQQNVQTNYERALDELERLVVMRLFELTKMSTSGTGTTRMCLSILINCSFLAVNRVQTPASNR